MSTLAPRDEAELAAAVATAFQARTPLAVEGGATRSGVGRPAQSERTLSTAALSGITLYEPAELVIGAKAGTPLKLVEQTLAGRAKSLSSERMDHRPLLGSTGEPTMGGV